MSAPLRRSCDEVPLPRLPNQSLPAQTHAQEATEDASDSLTALSPGRLYRRSVKIDTHGAVRDDTPLTRESTVTTSIE